MANDPGLRGLGPKDRRRALRNRREREAALRRNPLLPMTDREIQRQIQRDVGAGYDPLVNQIARNTRSAAANIEGVTNRLAQNLAGYQNTQRDIYDRARQGLTTLDSAVADRLGAGGAGLEAGLQRQAELSGAPVTSVPTAGAVGAGFARDSAETGALQLRQAASEEFAGKLPGFARMLGLQQVGELRAREKKDLQELNAKRLQTIAEMVSGARGREFQKAATRLGFEGDVMAQEAATRRTAMQQQGANARNEASISSRERIATANRRAQIANEIMKEGGRNARARAEAAKQGASVDVNRSAATGHTYLKNGQVLKYKSGPGKGKPVLWYGKKGVAANKRGQPGKGKGKGKDWG